MFLLDVMGNRDSQIEHVKKMGMTWLCGGEKDVELNVQKIVPSLRMLCRGFVLHCFALLLHVDHLTVHCRAFLIL